MKRETLQLTEAIDQAAAMNAARALDAVNGVSKVAIATSSGSISIDFDSSVTSVKELRAALELAGFALKRVHGEAGVCCGGCEG